MTLKALTADLKPKESFVKHYFIMGFRRTKKAMIILSILQVLGLPLTEILGTCNIKAEDTDMMDIFGILTSFSAVLSFLFFMCSVLAGITFALQSFNYLHKKTISDMYYSLPVSTNERFFADFLSGLISYLTPQLIGFIVTLPTTMICTCIAPNLGEAFPGESAIAFLIKVYMLLFALMLMFYVLCCLVNVLCGQFFETLVYTLIINGLIPGVIALVFLILFTNAYGVEFGGLTLNFLRMTSPLGVLIHMVVSCWESFSEYFALKSLILQILYMLIFTALYFVITFLLYRRRRSEDVGKPFAFSFIFYLLALSIVLCICSLGVVDEIGVYIGTAFVSLVFYMIMDVITKRAHYDVKTFLKSVLKGTVITAVSVTFVIICNNAHGFGAAERIPRADRVKSVEVQFYSYFSSEDYRDYELLEGSLSYQELTFTDKDMIRKITSLHSDLVDNYLEHKEEYDNLYFFEDEDTYDRETSSGYITIDYKLNSELTVSRSYEVYYDYYKILGKYLEDKDFVSGCFEEMGESLVEKAPKFNDNMIIYSPRVYYNSPDLGDHNSFSRPVTEELVKKITEAYSEDYFEFVKDDKNTFYAPEVGYIYIADCSLPVCKDYDNIIAILREEFIEKENYTMWFGDSFEKYQKGELKGITLYDSSMISVTISRNDEDTVYYTFKSGQPKAVYELADLVKKVKDYPYGKEVNCYVWYGDFYFEFPNEMIPEVEEFAKKYADDFETYEG